MRPRQMVLSLVPALVPLSSLHAQTPLFAQIGEANADHLGTAVAAIGDVTGDGLPDYAFGTEGVQSPGFVRVCSGADGSVITTLQGDQPNDNFGSQLAGVGDINGDTVPDLLVGAKGVNFGVGTCWIYSGADWTILREHVGVNVGHLFGQSLATMGDANGDGISEYLITRDGRVSCYDGATGAVLWDIFAPGNDGLGKLSVTTGDANGDGNADALIGAVGLNEPSYALVLDGTDGSEIHRVNGSAFEAFGTAVSWMGDLNGDSTPEFVVSRPRFSNPNAVGRIEIFDGSTGALYDSFEGTFLPGHWMCAAGDQNGDGVPDLVIEDDDQACLISGATWEKLMTYETDPMGGDATVMAPLGDLNGDGASEILIGAPRTNFTSTGTGLVFLSSEHPAEDLGFPLATPAGFEPHLFAEGVLEPGSVTRFRVSNTNRFSPMYLLIGYSANPIPFRGGTIVPSIDGILANLQTDDDGRWDFWCETPPDIPSNTEVYLQHWVIVPGGGGAISATNAIRMVYP